MSYIQLKRIKKEKRKKKKDYPYRWTWSKALYKDENASIYSSGPWKNLFLFSEEKKETTDKAEDYFYLFLYFMRCLDTKVINKI